MSYVFVVDGRKRIINYDYTLCKLENDCNELFIPLEPSRPNRLVRLNVIRISKSTSINLLCKVYEDIFFNKLYENLSIIMHASEIVLLCD